MKCLLKLPKNMNVSFGHEIEPEVKKKASFILKKILIKEVNPQWAPWFT